MGRFSREHLKELEEEKKYKEKSRCQEITDAPPQLIINGQLCNFFLEYGLVGPMWTIFNIEKDAKFAYICGYKDSETKEIIIHSGGNSPDYAIRNLMIRLINEWNIVLKDKEGNPINIVNCILDSREEVKYDLHINKHFIIKPNYHIDENGKYKIKIICPMCGSENVKTEDYNTLCPEALSGSKGTRYYCECGYHWDEKEIMM